MGSSPWACKESDATECLTHKHTHTHRLNSIQIQFEVPFQVDSLTIVFKS